MKPCKACNGLGHLPDAPPPEPKPPALCSVGHACEACERIARLAARGGMQLCPACEGYGTAELPPLEKRIADEEFVRRMKGSNHVH